MDASRPSCKSAPPPPLLPPHKHMRSVQSAGMSDLFYT
jgi:hypothetical protein